MIDIVFCSLPYSDLDHVYSAPAILKGVVRQHGYTAKTMDFGCELLKLCGRDVGLFEKIQNYFINRSTARLSDSEMRIVSDFYDLVVNYFEVNPSAYIGLSALSIFTHKCIYELLEKLKSRDITSKIIMGGRGANVPVWTQSLGDREFSASEKKTPFGIVLQRRGLIDHVILGDGEDAILQILSGKKVLSLTNNQSELFRSPVPDFEDYCFDDYLFQGTDINFPITGSKGCVRDCDFCDVRHHFGRYRYRSGSDVAHEMITIAEKFNFRKFQFTDSLVNGGLKPFREFLEIIGEYNQKNPLRRIRWNGQYICRPEEQMPTELYKLMAESGAEGLTIGAESFSNHVLEHMNKKTTAEALFHELEQFRKHGITCVLLNMVGHWSETPGDFLDNCRMFVKILPYVRSGTISAVSLGHPMMILEGTPAMVQAQHNNIVLSDFSPTLVWKVAENSSNTFKERVFRRLIMDKLARKLKVPLVRSSEEFLSMLGVIESNFQDIDEFYETSI
jgi:Radical SAM superfamily